MQKIRVKEPHTSFHHGVHLKVVSDMNSYGIFVTVAHHRLIFFDSLGLPCLGCSFIFVGN